MSDHAKMNPARRWSSRLGGAACIALLFLALAGCASNGAVEQVHARPVDQAIADGVKYLVDHQNHDGSWGSGTVSHGNEIEISVPGSHQAFKVAVTALCVMALREAGEHAAHDRGVEYLLTHTEVKRQTPELIYNMWTHIYVLQALVGEMKTNHDPRIASVIKLQLQRLLDYESYLGGWNYYDFQAGTEVPASGPTSFGTSAALVAFYEARQAGIEVPSRLIVPSLHQLEFMQLPNGAYLYGSDYKYYQTLPANLPQGSLGRSQGANLALLLWNSPKITTAKCRAGLDYFFANHGAIEMGRKRPYPHEAPYQTSGYYYYFDHYYTARLIEQLGPADRTRYTPKLLQTILPHQEPDGSWWDYIMWDYHKSYGTAFAIMTLLRCK